MSSAGRRRSSITVLMVALCGFALVAGSLASPAVGEGPDGKALPTCLGLAATKVGTAGPDTINGTAGNDVIVGGGGNDTINGLAGDDRICGNGGNDVIQAGPGNDQVQGGPGDDTINGGLGDDILKGGTGDDILKGGTGNDRLVGEAGDDALNGEMGTDTVTGGSGSDLCYGESKSSCEPAVITEPTPASGGLAEVPDLALSWQGSFGVSFDVYLGTSSDPPFYGSTTIPEIAVTDLAFNTDYTWQVVATDVFGRALVGPKWAFSTPAMLPLLPLSGVAAEVGSTVQLLPEWPNLTYTWTPSGDPALAAYRPVGTSFVMGPANEYKFNLSVSGVGVSHTDIVRVRPYESAGSREYYWGGFYYWAPQDFPIHYRINLGSYAGTPSAPALISAIQAGLQQWEDVTTSYAAFVYDGTTNRRIGNDGVNVIYADRSGASSGCTGGTYTTANGFGRYIDVDIAWNASSGAGFASAPATNLKALITREAGRLLGFSYTYDVPDSAVYYFALPSGLASYDVAMVSALYPTPTFGTETGSVSGVVETATGDPVSASVVVIDTAQTQPRRFQGYTDRFTGRFVVNGLSPGTYKIMIEASRRMEWFDPMIAAYALGGATVRVSAGVESNLGRITVAVPPEPLSPTFSVENVYPVPSANATYLLSVEEVYAYDHGSGLYTKLLEVSDSFMNAMDYDPNNRRIAVADQTGRRVYILDADPASPTYNQLIATVPNLPLQPVKLEYSADGTRLYVACNGAGSIAVIDTISNRLIAEIPLGNVCTQDVTVDNVDLKAYAAVKLHSGPFYELVEVELDPHSPNYHTVLRRVPLAGPYAWNVVTDGTAVYSTSGLGIERVDIATGGVSILPDTGRSYDQYRELALSPSGRYLYYFDYDDPILRNSQLYVYDLQAGDVAQTVVLSGREYSWLELSKDGSRIALSESDSANWLFFDLIGGLVP